MKGLSLLLAVSEVRFTISMHDIYKNNAIKTIPKHYLSLDEFSKQIFVYTK